MFNKINSSMFTSKQINSIQDLIKDLYNLGFENEKDRKDMAITKLLNIFTMGLMT